MSKPDETHDLNQTIRITADSDHMTANNGHTNSQHDVRVAAFGAIRRALGVARDLERGGWHKMEADAIRWAIRAALKQEIP